MCDTHYRVTQVRHFDLQSTRPRLLVVPANPKRPEHFLRPAQDPLFATTGQLSAMRLVSNTSFLPEDLLHCSVLLESARFAKCHWSELPAVCVGGHFELVSDRCVFLVYCTCWELCLTHGVGRGQTLCSVEGR